jgi:hypothetical protein
MPYFPGSAPPNIQDVNELRMWIEEELRRLATSLQIVDSTQYNVLYAEPLGPTAGMVVFADGTTWNPGSGRGLYEYRTSSWVKL